MSQALKRFSGEEAVRILTIHKSKGLEFDSVIMMAVEKETFFGKIEDSDVCSLSEYLGQKSV
jgi:ATP-dependent exoDNAse (exonuclease V) beta subunit